MMMCCRSEAAAAVKGVREIKVMVKKLKGKEKQQSRQLWEEIFTEDFTNVPGFVQFWGLLTNPGICIK